MIPVLFESNEQEYLTNGIGRLSSAVSCTVTEDSTGYYELEIKYPILGEHYRDIELDRIILAKPAQDSRTQPFYIYNISRPINGIVTINARHISYKLAGMVVMPYSAGSCYEALAAIPDHTVETCPFSFDTDKAVTGTFEITEPIEVRTLLGGSAGSILDVYGKGQYEFDRFSVYLHVNRGQDRGVTLRYGKNITDLTRKTDTSNLYVGIVPYWSNGEGTVVTLPEEVIFASQASEYTYKIVKAVDLSSEFAEQPTVNQLRERAQTYLENNEGWEIADNITVSFAALWQTEEYKDVAPLQTVKMGDTVTVIDARLGVKASSKVIRTVFDVLNDRYDKIELGTARNSLAQVIAESSLVKTIEPWVNQRFEVENGRFVSMIEQIVDEVSERVDLTYEDELTNSSRLFVSPPAVEDLAYLDTYGSTPCLIVDGTTVETYATTNRAYLRLIGDRAIPPIDVTMEFDLICEYETAPDPSNILFAFMYNREDTGQGWWHTFRYSSLDGGVPASGTQIHVKKTLTGKLASESSNVYFLFVFSPGVKMTITNVEAYDERDDYLGTVSSYISQTADNIELSVKQSTSHNFLQVTAGWNGVTLEFTNLGYVIRSGTINGHTCVIIDGTNASEYNIYAYAYLSAVGFAVSTDVTFSATVVPSINIPAYTSYERVIVRAVVGSSGVSVQVPAMTANQAYTLSRTYAFTGVQTSDTAMLQIVGYPGAILYVYDCSFNAKDDAYTESVLNISEAGISTKVSQNGVISAINQSAEQIQIQANKIDLVGSVYVTDNDAAPLLRVYWESLEEEGSTTIYGGSIIMINDDVSPAKDKFMSLGGGRVMVTDFNYWADDKSQYYAADRHYRFGASLEGPGLTVTRYEFDPNDPLFFKDQRMELEMIEQSYSQALGIKLGPDATIYHNTDVTGNSWAYTLAYNNCRFWVPVQFYGAVKNSGGTTQFTSDRRAKKSIKDIAKKAAKSFIMALRPRSFQFKDGESGRDHHGFIAQELHEAMAGKDWGVWCEDKDEKREQSVRYDEIIADMVSVIQQHEEEIAALRDRLAAIEGARK